MVKSYDYMSEQIITLKKNKNNKKKLSLHLDKMGNIFDWIVKNTASLTF